MIVKFSKPIIFNKIWIYNFWFYLVECSNNKYGQECNSTCGECLNGVQCNHVNGSCPNGCVSGVSGDKCDKGKNYAL